MSNTEQITSSDNTHYLHHTFFEPSDNTTPIIATSVGDSPAAGGGVGPASGGLRPGGGSGPSPGSWSSFCQL